MWSNFSIESVNGELVCKGTHPEEGTPVLVLSRVYNDHMSDVWSLDFLEALYFTCPKEETFTWVPLPDFDQPSFSVGDEVLVRGEVAGVYDDGYLLRLDGRSSFHVRKDIFDKVAKKG